MAQAPSIRGRTRTGTGFPPGDFLTLYGFRRGMRQALPLGSGLSLCPQALIDGGFDPQPVFADYDPLGSGEYFILGGVKA